MAEIEGSDTRNPQLPPTQTATPAFSDDLSPFFGGDLIGTDELGQKTFNGGVIIPPESPNVNVPSPQMVGGQPQFPMMVIPVAGVTADQLRNSFGAPRDDGARQHKGIDIAAPAGTPVVAAIGGTVVRAGDSGGAGGVRVWVKGDDGRAYYYAHLASTTVEVGQRVPSGAQLGTVGSTGTSTGPHLHFSINGQVGSENPVANPYEVLTGALSVPAPAGGIQTSITQSDQLISEPALGPNATDGEIRQYVKENFGALAWAIDQPELGPLLIQAAREGWTGSLLQAKITETQWWKTTEPSLRAWQALLAQDPAAAQARVDEQTQAITTLLQQAGLPLAGDRVREIAVQAVSLGWSTEEIKQAIGAEVDFTTQSNNPTGSFGQLINQLVATAEGTYMVPLSSDAAAKWARQIFEGTATQETFLAWAQGAAVSRYSQFTNEIRSGILPAQLFDSYRQQAGRVLEMDPDQVDMLGSPKFMRGLAVDDGAGGRRAMTLGEWDDYLRQLPEYRFTEQANESATSIARTLGKTFGVST